MINALQEGVNHKGVLMNKKILLVMLAIALVFAMALASCGDSGGGGSTDTELGFATYAGITSDSAYALTITESSARYAAQTGDAYVMSIVPLSGGAVDKSSGTVTVSGTALTLDKGGTVTVNSSGGITAITGTINLDGGGTHDGPGDTTTPSAIGSEFVGRWTEADFSISIKADGTFEYVMNYMGKKDFTVKGVCFIDDDDYLVFIPANFKHEGPLCYADEEKEHMSDFIAGISPPYLQVFMGSMMYGCTK
jgi:hypothetical protein